MKDPLFGADRTLSRRSLGLLAAAAASTPAFARASAITAGELVDKIRQAGGGTWRGGELEGLVLGDPATPVRGVAVTAIPTVSVIQKAQRQGLNLIVGLESPLYARPFKAPADPSPGAQSATRTADGLAGDPIYKAKLALIERQKLAVVRLNETFRAHAPDPLRGALAKKLGWTGGEPDRPGVHVIAPTPLRTIIGAVKGAVGARGGLRYVGDPDMLVRRVLVVPGTSEVVSVTQGMRDADLLLTGDLREWEIVEYIFDSRQAGPPKGLIATGRVLSEQPGVAACAAWLSSLAPDLKVQVVANTDPYWRLPA